MVLSRFWRASIPVLAAGLWLGALAGQARAGEPYDDRFFVKHGGTAQEMLDDRAECRRQALALGMGDSSYSNAQYGALAALGSALDSDALHDGGIRRRMQNAVLESCMDRQGWTPLEPTKAEARDLARVPGRDEALTAWLKAHEPAETAPPTPDTGTPPGAQTATALPGAKSATPAPVPDSVLTGIYARATPVPSTATAPAAPAVAPAPVPAVAPGPVAPAAN